MLLPALAVGGFVQTQFSSVCPSQSSSILFEQISDAPGFMLDALSLQSVELFTKPVGAPVHEVVEIAALPYPSPSAST